jgi:deoxyribodipyrimidine photolyase-related protein
MYVIYLLEGDRIREMNFLKANWKLNKKQYEKFWNATTGIKPIDDAIINIEKYAYVHHIIRLMYLGNFTMMLGINPNSSYQLFMEWTIDAYDWVMVPNVYAMSQHAEGGLVMTRPYFSSSNYIIKMSDYKKGEWSDLFDAIYYNFINNNIDYLKKNYATSRQVAHWNKKSAVEKKNIINRVNAYITNF